MPKKGGVTRTWKKNKVMGGDVGKDNAMGRWAFANVKVDTAAIVITRRLAPLPTLHPILLDHFRFFPFRGG